MLKIVHLATALCILLSFSFATNLIHPAQATVVRVPGVVAGDWVKYQLAFNYSTNDPNPVIGPPPPEISDVEYYRMIVDSVVGTNITYTGTIHYKNGTETSFVTWTDVSTGYMGGILFIAANLTAGDALYEQPYSPVINGTTMRTYAGMEREVNYVDILINSSGPYGTWVAGESTFYWDRFSGAGTEFLQYATYTRIPEGYRTYTFLRIIMTETNIWSAAFQISAEVRFLPGFLNLRSMGMWIMAFIELPEGYDARNIDVSTIRLNESVPAEPMRFRVMWDFDRDGKRELLVKFSRAAVETFLLKQGSGGRMWQRVTLTLTGKLRDGTSFGGSDKIIVFYPANGHHFFPLF